MNPLSAFITVPEDRQVKTISLTNSDAVVLISDADYERVSQYRWFLKRAKSPAGQGNNAYYYAARSKTITTNGKRKVETIWLHRWLKDNPDGDVHHKDGDKLNCQQDNLEPIDHSEHGQRYNGKDEIPF